MAEEGTLCVREDVLAKCGENHNTDWSDETDTNRYIKMAEGYVSAQTRYDWVTKYSSVSTIGREALRDVTACLAAIDVINQDMSGFTSRTEAQVMLDVLRFKIVELINVLRDDRWKQFVISGSED